MLPRRRIAVLLLALLLAFGLLLFIRSKTSQTSQTLARHEPQRQTVPAPKRASLDQEARPARKRFQITAEGKVRLKRGESAVLGYLEIAPGMNGLVIVTPEMTQEGQVKMTTRLLQMTDDAVEQTDTQELFPDIFDFENIGAIDSQRLAAVTEAIHDAKGVDMLSYPTLVSRPGQEATISSGVSDAKGEFAGYSLSLRAHPLANNDGCDLIIEFKRSE